MRARALAATLAMVAGALVAGCDAEHDAKVEQAAHRCEPLSTSTPALSASFPRLGTVASATWCVRALGTPDKSRVTIPGPHDWAYYAVVRLADTAAVEAWGPWQPTENPQTSEMPATLRSLVPAQGRWSSNEAGAYLDRASATVVLNGASADTVQP
ncbi:hypothetical protein [Embleya sp. NBC_00896]|uniref:hypothetical protein n=1 Tax=Embleya sp. NBC_00896 TaxID=2975961 RepID=UPI002F90FA02|nr:hypothetical protein OG928_42935 [Embleya sp. NBC_00896]